jgi:hypothetical protein
MEHCVVWLILRLLAVFLLLLGNLVNTHALKSARFLVAASFPFGGAGAGDGLYVGLCVARSGFLCHAGMHAGPLSWSMRVSSDAPVVVAS